MTKLEYETMPEETEEMEEINFNYTPFPELTKSSCETTGIVCNTMRKMNGLKLQNLIEKAERLEKLYYEILSKTPRLTAAIGKHFGELDQGKQREILLAVMILHGIAFTQLQKETFRAKNAARWVTSKTMEWFIYNDD